MGVKYFFSWFRKQFASSIYQISKNQPFSEIKSNNRTDVTCLDGKRDFREKENEEIEPDISIDNLMIDMNGLFHTSAQKVYEYGNFKPKESLLGNKPRKVDESDFQKQLNVFKDICKTMDHLLFLVNPKKRVILCVDGPAPLSKQNQQRQRRFLSAIDRETSPVPFDSNSITPGTKFMDFLTKYIDWHIRNEMSKDSSPWSKVEVVFSNEKSPGEGEHKLINYIRKYGNIEESYCIHGMDADLIMLSLGTHYPKFWILREDNNSTDLYVIDIGTVRDELAELMRWVDKTTDKDSDGERVFKPTNAINDFIFMCFTVGNDFLPHIPCIEILENGIELMLDVYKNVCESYGHLTRKSRSGIKFKRQALKAFIGTISQYEKGVLEDKLKHKDKFFPDPILEGTSSIIEGKYSSDVDRYRECYYASNLEKVYETKDYEKLCHDYLDGMQWVITYYTQGIPDWKWRYPYHYAPFSFTLGQHIETYEFKDYQPSTPTVPFVQLLSVLPPKSADLLPTPLDNVLRNDLVSYCPDDVIVDMCGKRQAWEATVLLPMIDYSTVEELYLEAVKKVEEKELKRNALGKSFVYNRSDKSYEVVSFYGNFTCRVSTKVIEL